MNRLLALNRTYIKFFKYSLFGGIIFSWGLLANFLLVDSFHFEKKIAYVCVISSQILVCFFLNRYVVFENRERNIFQTFSGYLAALAVFRMLDWTLYVIQINWLGLPYLLAQTINNVLIFCIKFPIYRFIFERHSPELEMYKKNAD